MDAIWPPVCSTCVRSLPLMEDSAGEGRYFCPECLADLELRPPAGCPVCGRPHYYSVSHLCGDCLASPPPWSTAAWAAVYQGTVARSIALLKYHGGLNQIPALAALGTARLPRPGYAANGDEEGTDHDLIVPMPLSPKRLEERGFNQAEELALAIYRPWRDRLETRLLVRNDNGGRHQAALPRSRRLEAVKGCFAVADPARVEGAAILLFDDVFTTGATAGEAARTLKKAGAARVDVYTIARTVLQFWR